MYWDDDDDGFGYDRDMFMMSESYRDMTPDWVFPELNYLKEEDEESWNSSSDEEKEEEEEPKTRKYNYHESEKYKAFKKHLDDSWVKDVKYWTKFYRKHKVLNFVRKFLFWVPRYYENAPERIKKRAEEEIRKGI